jgi:membrane protein implicated in regulation of membrane protease activity
VAAHLSVHTQAMLFGKTFFPHLIMPAFMAGLHDVFYVSAALALIAAVASLLRGERYIHGQEHTAAAVQAASVAPKGGSHATALRPVHSGPIPRREVAASHADDGHTGRGAGGRSE